MACASHHAEAIQTIFVVIIEIHCEEHRKFHFDTAQTNSLLETDHREKTSSRLLPTCDGSRHALLRGLGVGGTPWLFGLYLLC